MDEFIGWVVGIVVVGFIGGLAYLVVNIDNDPCTPRRVEYRQELIEAHERCKVEENCIYEDWNILRYDAWIEQRAACLREEENG